MISIEMGFDQILQAIEPSLAHSGFSRVDEKSHPETFGGRHITFGDGHEFIRLAWNGEKGWFVLESIPASSITLDHGWTDILLQFFKPRHDGAEVVAEIAGYMKAALRAYIGLAE
jgi:hypothetical protein